MACKDIICTRCFHSYMCEEYNADRDFPRTRCAYANDHFVDIDKMVQLPVKVGQTVYYINRFYHIALSKDKIYEAKVVRIVTTYLGTVLVIQIKDENGCTEIPDVRDFGKTVFLTREEAEKALKGESK